MLTSVSMVSQDGNGSGSNNGSNSSEQEEEAVSYSNAGVRAPGVMHHAGKTKLRLDGCNGFAATSPVHTPERATAQQRTQAHVLKGIHLLIHNREQPA